jgi:sulfur carrier protein ThiS
MPTDPLDKKNSLQSIVDSIQTQAATSVKSDSTKGYVPNPELKSLRTFQGDIQEHIDTKKETITSIAIAEQKKKIENNIPTYTERPKSSGYTPLLTIIAVICFIGGGVIFGGLYFFNTQKETEVAVATKKTIIPYTQKKEIVVPETKEGALAQLISARDSFVVEVNGVLYTSFLHGTSSLSTADTLQLVTPRIGDTLKRNISDIMVGVYSYDTNEIFIIVKPDDFGIAYSEMLNKENTLVADMSPLFPKLSTYLSSNPPVFIDETYKNKDVRVIKNAVGEVVFLYGFIDRNTLVMTANERIFEAILNKYTQSKLVR